MVVVPSTEEWDRRKTLQKESEDATIPDDAMGEMKGEDCCFSLIGLRMVLGYFFIKKVVMCLNTRNKSVIYNTK